MKSFDDVISDKEPLNEGLYAEWKVIFDEIDKPSRVERMLLDIMYKLDFMKNIG